MVEPGPKPVYDFPRSVSRLTMQVSERQMKVSASQPDIHDKEKTQG